MKLKDIRAGVPYTKRGKTGDWGVPVTTDSFFSPFPLYDHSKKYLHEGSGVLVLVSNSYALSSQKRMDKAVEIIQSLSGFQRSDLPALKESIKDEGISVEVWLARDFLATREQAIKDEKEQYARDAALRKQREEIKQSLSDQFESISDDLGIDVNAFFNMEKDRVTMTFIDWKKLMGRIDSLLQSGPLNQGML